jgi:hypothetical protein
MADRYSFSLTTFSPRYVLQVLLLLLESPSKPGTPIIARILTCIRMVAANLFKLVWIHLLQRHKPAAYGAWDRLDSLTRWGECWRSSVERFTDMNGCLETTEYALNAVNQGVTSLGIKGNKDFYAFRSPLFDPTSCILMLVGIGERFASTSIVY